MTKLLSIIAETKSAKGRHQQTTGRDIDAECSNTADDSAPRSGGHFCTVVSGRAVRLDDQDLLAEINKRLVAFRDTPEFTALMDKYALTKDEAVKPGMTTEKACTE